MSARISSSPSQDLVPQTADPHAPTVKFSRGSAEPSEDFDGRDALPVGTRLDEFEVLHVLGTGGFGIVYLALDHALMRQVAIKEYMPSALAVRGLGS
jgi:serine/threonine protein kinase